MCLLLSIFATSSSASLVNVDVKRIIDVSSTLAIARSTVSMKNEGNAVVDSFVIAIHQSEAESVYDVWACDAAAKPPFKALPIQLLSRQSDLAPKTFKIWFATPLQPGRQATVELRMDIANSVKPVPAQLSGLENQFMRYEGSSYFYTPYQTETMETTIILGSASLTSQNGIIEPSSLSGKRFKLGPYSDIAAQTYKPMRVRFKNDRGFLVASKMTKQLDVGHWGFIRTVEEYKVINNAAKHVGEWSRLDYAEGRGTVYGTAVGDVWANLPSDAGNVLYKDLIGNVTSSRLRVPSKGKRPIQLVFRYPLMGGWHNHFWFTYDLKHDKYVKVGDSSGVHTLKLLIWPSLNTDLLCEELNIRVLLPEWSDDIEIDDHPSLKFNKKLGSERTSLTLLGRPVVTLNAKMVRSQSKHGNAIVIRYKYNPFLRWVSPLVTVFGIIIFFTFLFTCVKSGLDVERADAGDAEKIKTT